MFGFKRIFVLFVVTFALCESAFVDTLQKCNYEDIECITKAVKKTFAIIADTGILELNIPSIDPFPIENLKMKLLNVVDVTVIEGTVKGLKNCEISDINVNFEKGHYTMKVLCNLLIKGKYDIRGSSPALKDLFGGTSVSGNGNAKLNVEKVMIKFDFKFDVIRGSDGETYISCKKDLAKYDFELLGSSKLQIDKLLIGDVESSQIFTNYYNENDKILWKNFGREILDTAATITYDLINKFFSGVPTKHYLLGDLTQFIKE